MKPTFKTSARILITALLMLPALTSMTGCSERYVVIQGEETTTVKKSTLDNLYSDNERLLRALGKCQAGK